MRSKREILNGNRPRQSPCTNYNKKRFLNFRAAASDVGCELTIELTDDSLALKNKHPLIAEINVRIDNSPNWNTPKDVWLPLQDPPTAQQSGTVTGQLRMLIQTIPYKVEKLFFLILIFQLTTPEKQGYLNKKEKSGLFTSFKQYWFYLHEGNLFYLKVIKKYVCVVYFQYSKPCGFIHLSHAEVEKCTNKKKKFAFEIGTSQYGHKKEVLYAKNDKEMEEWMAAIKKVTNRKPFVFGATPQIVKVIFLVYNYILKFQEQTLEVSKQSKKEEDEKKEKKEKVLN